MKTPDGRVDPAGKTFKKLIAQVKPTASAMKGFLFGPTPGNIGLLTKVDPNRLRSYIIKQPGLGLSVTKGEDFLGFFKDIRWAAYIIATVHHETTFSFMINKRETGKGNSRYYGKIEKVTDVLGCRGSKNAVYENAYYGRGYVQVTLKDNYKRIGKAYGIGDELYINPDRVFEPKIAYFATSDAMRLGLYTGHKLEDHINGQKCDYKNARRIINGVDKWIEIAERAKMIELLLRLCVNSQFIILNDHLFHLC